VKYYKNRREQHIDIVDFGKDTNKPDIFEETYSDVSQLEENQERIITLDSYKDISLELVLMNDEVSEYRVTGCLENGWSYWFTDFEEAVLSYFEAKLTNN